jgi:sigma-B regulation protein RsbU (phosphoserine phosphatase)
VNQVLRMERVSSMFVTCFVGVLDLRSGELEYSNAGHNPPLLLRGDGRVEPTELTGGLVLGQFARATYASKSARLSNGDGILLYTDGVTEAMNPEYEQFGDERFRALLADLRGRPAEERVRSVLEAVTGFARGAAQSDDITLLNITYEGMAERRQAE